MPNYSCEEKQTKPGRQWYQKVSVPLEEQLYELWGNSEGSVRGEEDPAVFLFLVARVKEVIHKQVQSSSLQTPHFAGSVLDKCTAWTLLTGVGGGDRLPTQGHPINCTILDLLTPFLHWVLGMAEVGNRVKGLHQHSFWGSGYDPMFYKKYTGAGQIQ